MAQKRKEEKKTLQKEISEMKKSENWEKYSVITWRKKSQNYKKKSPDSFQEALPPVIAVHGKNDVIGWQ